MARIGLVRIDLVRIDLARIDLAGIGLARIDSARSDVTHIIAAHLRNSFIIGDHSSLQITPPSRVNALYVSQHCKSQCAQTLRTTFA